MPPLREAFQTDGTRRNAARAFFFDLDGTLVDTEGFWAQAIADEIRSCGGTAAPDEILDAIWGRSWLDIHAHLKARYPHLAFGTARDDAARLRKRYSALVAGRPDKLVFRRMARFFRHMAKYAPCAVVSGSPKSDVLAAVEVCGLSDVCRFVLGGEDYTTGKPSPEPFLAAAARLGIAPESAVAVEDSPAGVESALAAGMRTIALVPPDRENHPAYTRATWRIPQKLAK